MPPERQTTARRRAPFKLLETDIPLSIVTRATETGLFSPLVYSPAESAVCNALLLILGLRRRLHVDIHVILVDFRCACVDEDRVRREGVLGIVGAEFLRVRVEDLVKLLQPVVAHGVGFLRNSRVDQTVLDVL